MRVCVCICVDGWAGLVGFGVWRVFHQIDIHLYFSYNKMYGNLFSFLAIKFQINYTVAQALSLKNSLKLNNRFESLSARECELIKMEGAC